MPPPRRAIRAATTASTTPPPALPPTHAIMRVLAPAGNHLVSVERASGEPSALVELPARLRGAVWVRRGGFVVVDTAALGERANKLVGEVVTVVAGRAWAKMPYWPEEWRDAGKSEAADANAGEADDDEDEGRGQQSGRMGEMPPSQSESDEEDAQDERP